MRITNPSITDLKENEIFVFGSNLSGIHGGGAAKLAYDKFGAIWGNGRGIQGNSYAIPTKSKGIKYTLNLMEIGWYVSDFISYAKLLKNKTFLVTEIGCGLAWLKVEEIAPLFKSATELENIYLPERFLKILFK